MENLIKDLIALSLAMSPIKAQLHTHVKQIALEYAEAEEMRYEHGGERPYKSEDINDWNIDGSTIEADWSTHWAYGGHAEGTVCFPAIYLYDTEKFNLYKSECQRMKDEWQASKKQIEEKSKLVQLERLKAELHLK